MFSFGFGKDGARRGAKERHENAVNLHLSHLVRWMHKIKRSLILTATGSCCCFFYRRCRCCRDDYMAI